MPMSASDIERLSSATPRTRTAAVDELHVQRAGLELLGGDLEHLVAHLPGRAADRAGEHHRQPRAARPGARQPVRRRVVGDRDVGRLDLQLVGHELGDDGLGRVAPERREHRHADAAGRADRDAARSRAWSTCRRTAPGCGTRTRSRRRSSAAGPAPGRCRCSGPPPAPRACSARQKSQLGVRERLVEHGRVVAASRRCCRSGSCTGTGPAGSGCAGAARSRRSRAPPRRRRRAARAPSC